MIESIRNKFTAGLYEFSKHAVDQMLVRDVQISEIREAIENGEIIEDYPNDKYGPSCLILGKTTAQRSLHIQCSYPSRPLIKVVTVYEPDAGLWDNLRIRRML